VDTPRAEIATGSLFAGRYQVIEELGRGGMGRVYRALDKKLSEEVALKVIRPEVASDRTILARFHSELKLARKISHRNVGRMYELMEEKGTHFITMEYVPGEDLRSFIRRSGQLTVGKAVAVARQVGEGLAEAHRAGVVHRDLKPSNIIIDKEGNARIMDFGIARSLKGKGTTDARVMIGTPEYMSPEQVDGTDVDARADIYALGVVLFEMLTGHVPFEGDTALSVALKQKTETPHDPREINPQIPEPLSHLILRCLEKDKAKRYQTAEGLISELDTIASGLTPTSGILRPLGAAKAKKKRLAMIGAGALTIVAAAAAFFIISSSRLNVDPNRVVVAPFENKTGDPSLDPIGNIAADWIAQGISQAGQKIDVVPGMAAQESSKVVEKEQGKLQGAKQLRALAKETGAGTVVTGAYYLQGGELQFQADITDVQKGKLIYASPSVAGKKDNPMEVIKNLQQRLVGAIAAHFDIDMDGFLFSSPPTFEAYQEYLRGIELFGKDYSQAFVHSNRAVELDPTFLMPKALIATGYANQGNYEKAKQIFDELNQNRTQLDQFTRLWMDAMMADMRGQPEEALRYCRQWARLAPNSWLIAYNVGDWELALNRPQKVIEEYSRIDLKKTDFTRFSTGSWLFSNWANAYHMLGKYGKELEITRRGEKYFPEIGGFLVREARSFAAQGKIGEVRKVIERSLTTTSTGTPADVMTNAAEELRAHGHPKESEEFANQAVSWYKSRPAEEAQKEENRSSLANSIYIARRWKEALNIYEALLSEKPDDIDYKGYVGLCAARLGDREKALKISGELKALTTPYLFGANTYYRASIASVLGDKEQAISLLRESFAQGRRYGVYLHRDPGLEALRDYKPFQELLKPKG